MNKIFVLDTNVLIHNPFSIFSFGSNMVVIPITVIEEIDKFKKGLDEKSRNAREVGRILDSLRKKASKSLKEGVEINKNGRLFVGISHKILDYSKKLLLQDNNDNLIISTALYFQEKFKPQKVVLISKDANVRIKADVLGLETENYKADQVDFQELYTGYSTMMLSNENFNFFLEKGFLKIKKSHIMPNEFLILENGNKKILGRFSSDNKVIYNLSMYKKEDHIFGIKARNMHQEMAFDLLLDKSVMLVSLVGMAGTGKTLLALASGMQQVAQEGFYKKMVVSRPIFPMGKDLGFLPGSKKEKFNPWMQPIYDNMEMILGSNEDEIPQKRKNLESYIDFGLLELEPLTYIRGRTLSNQFLVIDEAQNLTSHEIKTIITRAGKNTKIVFTGDPYQIDVPYLDSSSNGLSVMVEKLKSESLVGHITLIKGERSELAQMTSRAF